jgi:hypothetical protein
MHYLVYIRYIWFKSIDDDTNIIEQGREEVDFTVIKYDN